MGGGLGCVDDGLWERIVPLLPQVKRNPRYPGRPRLDDRKVRAGLLDFARAAVDSSRLRPMKGGPATGPSPVDRAKTGSKHHLIVEAYGIPLAAITTGGNRNDATQLPLIEAIQHAFVTLGCAIICWRRLGQERLRSSDQK